MERDQVKKVVLCSVLALILVTPLQAATYYFSDCNWIPGANFQPTGSLCDHATSGLCRRCYLSPGGIPICEDVACTGVESTCVGAPTVQLDKGSRENPWCLSPEIAIDECTANGAPYACCTGVGAGTCPGRKRRSFTAMSDGGIGSNLTTELAAGDTVFLCAGPCDGQGSAVYYIEASSSTGNSACDSGTKPIFWMPQVDGTSSSAQIIVQVYCNNLTDSCERVSFTSDSNMNGVFDSGEPQVFMANAKNSSTLFNDMSWITIDGDPMRRGERNIRFDNWGDRTNNTLVSFDCTDTGTGDGNNSDGVDNITFRGIEVDGFGYEGWSGLDMFDSHCIYGSNLGDGGYVFKVNDLGGDLNIVGSTFRNICGMVTRFNNNPDAAAVFNFTDNLAVNGYQLTNDHDFIATASGGATFNYLRNTVVDFWSGIAAEQNVNNFNVTDNDISCSGTRRMGDFFGGPCMSAISVNDGDTPMCGHCLQAGSTNNSGNAACSSDAICTPLGMTCPECWGGQNILIARNKIHGNGATNFGRMQAGIMFGASHNSGSLTNVIIENNIIWGLASPQSGGTSSCDPFNNPLYGRSAIGVCTSSDGLVVQGNTLWGDQNGITLNGTGDSTLEANIVGLGSGGQELQVYSDAAGATLTKNLFYDTGNPVTFNGVSYNCPGVTSLNNGAARTGNFCPSVAPALTKVSGAPSTWALSLLSTDTSGALNGDSACVGPTADYERQSRPYPVGGSCDVGMDEYTPITPAPISDPPAYYTEATN